MIAENNVHEFPERDLVLLSMANIYLALKRKEEAIKFYGKTLLLNPNNEEAKNRLNELKKIN
jgi:tetratricopeptide (TPR) repeat protein